MRWKTDDGYELPDDLEQDEVKSFFGGRIRERNANDTTGRIDSENDNGIRCASSENKPVSKSKSEGTTAGKD